MTSLAKCIERAGISKADGDALMAAAKAYRGEGFSGGEANSGAVQDAIDDLTAERQSSLKRHFTLPSRLVPRRSRMMLPPYAIQFCHFCLHSFDVNEESCNVTSQLFPQLPKPTHNYLFSAD